MLLDRIKRFAGYLHISFSFTSQKKTFFCADEEGKIKCGTDGDFVLLMILMLLKSMMGNVVCIYMGFLCVWFFFWGGGGGLA